MPSKRDRFDVVAIRWDDAGAKFGVTHRSELPLRYQLTTIGHIAHEDDDFVSIVSEVVDKDDGDGVENEYRQVTTIPKSLIRERIYYRRK